VPTTECIWANPGQTTPCASQNNVGDAEVWGVELEAQWYPTEALGIDASFSTLDFEYQSIVPGATSVTLGMITPYTPEAKWSLGLQYAFTLGSGGTLTPRIDASFQDDVYANAVNAPTNFIEDYTLVNARVTWESVDGMWQLALEGTNLTDEYYYVTLFDLSSNAAGYIHGQPSRPREWAVTVKRSF
jgi:iron complex outermembrane receptor protein